MVAQFVVPAYQLIGSAIFRAGHADFQYSVRFVDRVLDSSICIDIDQVLVRATYTSVLNLSFSM
jgi:hypothetical protein